MSIDVAHTDTTPYYLDVLDEDGFIDEEKAMAFLFSQSNTDPLHTDIYPSLHDLIDKDGFINEEKAMVYFLHQNNYFLNQENNVPLTHSSSSTGSEVKRKCVYDPTKWQEIRNCSYNLRNNHIGGKSSSTTRSFQISVNHRRKILHSTIGFPGKWNDQTVVRFDEFVTKIHRGELYDDINYIINGETFRGVWIACDNGYLAWSATVAPIKKSCSQKEIRLSKWLEAIRKDVECTFGILKGRWRILKTGIRQHSLECCDDIWFTCCALHNMLLDVDGLNEKWKSGCRSDYEEVLGLHEVDDVETFVPAAFRRLKAVGANRSHDSAIGARGVAVQYEEEEGEDEEEEVRPMERSVKPIRLRRQVSHDVFRKCLVQHFDTEWIKKNVVWPTRNCKEVNK